ncbi:hypothetical protein [Aliiroseovarius crassostreae]|uniref:hypothetical protein n=1 Tax=Aliiroseovarius crassostreae TaxID=154981 RepID=UPI0035CCDA7E
MSGDLRVVVNAFEVSSRTMRNIRQNLFWAFGYKTALIPVAAGVLSLAFGMMLSPVLAAGAMTLSSVFVLTNALRLRRVAPLLDEKSDHGREQAHAIPAPAENGGDHGYWRCRAPIRLARKNDQVLRGYQPVKTPA